MSGSSPETELLDFGTKTSCIVSNLETFKRGLGSMVTPQKAILCDSLGSGECYAFDSSKSKFTRIDGRVQIRESELGYPAAVPVILNQTSPALLIMGMESATDIITLDKISAGPQLDNYLHVMHFCLTQINSTTIARVGAFKKSGSTFVALKTTYFCHMDGGTSWRWIQGPDMRDKRYWNGCNVFEHLGKSYIIAVGGSNDRSGGRTIKSVEILDLANNIWVKGKLCTYLYNTFKILIFEQDQIWMKRHLTQWL